MNRLGRTACCWLAAGAVLGTGGCSGYTAMQDLPLPGGAALGSHPYTVRADFSDVLSLVPQASVEVNDVPVGRVTRISLAPGGWTAVVTMQVNGDVRLPGNAYASLEQSSLLGEKYIELSAPRRTRPRPARWPTAGPSRWPGPTARPRSRRSSGRCRCC